MQSYLEGSRTTGMASRRRVRGHSGDELCIVCGLGIITAGRHVLRMARHTCHAEAFQIGLHASSGGYTTLRREAI